MGEMFIRVMPGTPKWLTHTQKRH